MKLWNLDGKLYRKVYKALGKWKELEEINQMVERREPNPTTGLGAI